MNKRIPVLLIAPFLLTGCYRFAEANTSSYEIYLEHKNILLDSHFMNSNFLVFPSEFDYIEGGKYCRNFISDYRNKLWASPAYMILKMEYKDSSIYTSEIDRLENISYHRKQIKQTSFEDGKIYYSINTKIRFEYAKCYENNQTIIYVFNQNNDFNRIPYVLEEYKVNLKSLEHFNLYKII